MGTVVCHSGFIPGYNDTSCVRLTQISLTCIQDRDCQPPASCVNLKCDCALNAIYNSTLNICIIQTQIKLNTSNELKHSIYIILLLFLLSNKI